MSSADPAIHTTLMSLHSTSASRSIACGWHPLMLPSLSDGEVVARSRHFWVTRSGWVMVGSHTMGTTSGLISSA
jgi:hypothetical protein